MQVIGEIEHRGVRILQFVKFSGEIVALNIIGAPILVRSVIVTLQSGKTLNLKIGEQKSTGKIDKIKNAKNLEYIRNTVTVGNQKLINAFIHLPQVKTNPEYQEAYILANTNDDCLRQFQNHLMAHTLLPFTQNHLPKIWELAIKKKMLTSIQVCVGFDSAWYMSFTHSWDDLIIEVIQNGT